MNEPINAKVPDNRIPGLGGIGEVVFDLTGHKPVVSGGSCPECGGSSEDVTWRDLAEFCEWLTERLHAEAVQPGANRYNPPPPEPVTPFWRSPSGTGPPTEPGDDAPFTAIMSSPQTAELNRDPYTGWAVFMRDWVNRRSR